MYPLSDPALYLSDIARHWAREPFSMSETEILDRLLSAFWTGELVATFNPKVDAQEQRPKALQAAATMEKHPGLVFIPVGKEPPPIVTDLPDGGALVDRRIPLVWPPATESDPNQLAEEAFQQLAQVALADYAPDIQPALTLLQVTRVDFDAFCRERSYPLPKFWFQKSDALTPAAAKAKFRHWLKAQGSGPKPCPKAKMRAMALKMGVSGQAFDQIWSEEAPQEWRRAGAPSKTRP